MSEKITQGLLLSYIITTRNRLPFLKITLDKLIENIQPDEEILVIDSDSTDGTFDYLKTLYEKGKIHQFISEPDKNQAHGWNKAMLLARGILIKKIIDDDIFCYSAIRKCKDYMLANQKVDVIISNDLSSSLTKKELIEKHSRLDEFKDWKSAKTKSFTFGDIHMIIRKSALTYIGLYNTGFTMMDWEYALRISYLRANIAYYTGYNALSVSHDNTVSALKNLEQIKEQGKKAQFFYEYAGDSAKISTWSKIKIVLGKILLAKKTTSAVNVIDENNLKATYQYLQEYLNTINQEKSYDFIN